MKRRALFGFASSSLMGETQAIKTFTPKSNGNHSGKPGPSSGINKYSGTWDRARAAHLLRRTMFGPRKDEIELALSMGMEGTVNLLINTSLWEPSIAPPYTISSKGEINYDPAWSLTANKNKDDARTYALKTWWTHHMLHQNISIREKMTLFLHNTLVTSTTGVNDARLTFKYIQLLRDNCLSNYKTLVRSMATNPAMLTYLHAKDNIKGSPNEDFARELMELFTLGREDFNGRINYTENDVVELARCITGWSINTIDIQNLATNNLSKFKAINHDTGPKHFSVHFNNRVIHRTLPTEYEKELDDVIDMLFERFETAYFIVREVYRWFVYYDIDPVVEKNFIQPLGDMFRNSGYDLKLLMKVMLESEHFNDDLCIGVKIKDPVEFTIGTFRQTSDVSTYLNDSPDYKIYFAQVLQFMSAELQMDILSPPTVAGWSPLYQLPSFSQLWINAFSILKRTEILEIGIKNGITKFDNLVNVPALINNSFKRINIALLFQNTSAFKADDIHALIDGLSAQLFPIDITPLQKQRLKDVLLEGMSESDWALTWNSYFASSQLSQTENQATRQRLEHFLSFMMGMAEYQLS